MNNEYSLPSIHSQDGYVTKPSVRTARREGVDDVTKVERSVAEGVHGTIKLMSFGFKYGPPAANYYFDVSFAVNPARQDRWGMDALVDHEMVDFVLFQSAVGTFIELVVPLIEHTSRLDSYQVVAFGCNSGRHRSPIIVNEVASRLVGKVPMLVEHRDLPDSENVMYSIEHR